MLKQDSVLERLMPALDLALGLRMIRRSVDMLDVLLVQPIGKIARDIRRAVVRQKPWPVNYVHLDRARTPPNARSSVAVTSCAFIVAQSFQATMKREKSSSTVER